MHKAKSENITVNYDLKLLFPVLFLVGIGLVMVYSASSALALKRYGSDYYFLQKQAAYSVLGIIALVACSYTPYKLYSSFAYLFLGIAFILLIGVKIPGIGHTAGGATRWIKLFGFTFQPSEYARFAMVIYLAYSMSKKQEQIKELAIGFLPHVIVMVLLSALILMQPDFGSVAILFALTWIMMFAGGVKVTQLGLSLFPILPLACYMMLSADYRVKRILSFMNPWQYQSDEGYQMVHSLMAFGSGGFFGSGFGHGYQKLFYLPEPHTDFIFSVIGEELGLVGVLGILSLYIVIFWRGVIIARNAEDTFGSLTAAGLTVALGLEVCINIGVVMGLLPTKGLALPFISYGGSSLLINLASIGILMNIGASFKNNES